MNKKTKWIIGGLLVAILIIFVIGQNLGWFKPKLKLKEGDGNVDTLPSGAIDESRYKIIARTVFDSLSGLNYQSSYFSNVADQLLGLNKNELRVTANVYNRDFGEGQFQTLRSRIASELVGSSWGLLGLVPTPCSASEKTEIDSNCYKQAQILDRLNQINA